MSLLGLIPARGGSKGIPRKNLRILAGKPLIAWTILAASEAGLVDRVVVSTEDAEIAQVAEHWGAEVPFLRPLSLAADDTPGIDPVMHAIDALPNYEWVLLLQPTSPLRRAMDIDAIIDKCRRAGAPAAVSVSEATAHPDWTFEIGSDGRFAVDTPTRRAIRRQDLSKRYALNGALYLARTDWLRSTQSFVTSETLVYEMPQETSVDIDSETDWQLAEHLMNCSSA